MAFDILRDNEWRPPSLFAEDRDFVGGSVVPEKDSTFERGGSDLGEIGYNGEIPEDWIIAMSQPWKFTTQRQPEAVAAEPVPLAVRVLGGRVTDMATAPLPSSSMALYPAAAR